MKFKDSQNQLAIIKTGQNLQQDIKNGIDLIGGLNLSRDSNVIIKPNLCCIRPPETGATTDVKVVGAIVTYLQKEHGVSDISIAESDGTQVLADIAFKLLGYERLSKKLNIKLLNFSSIPAVTKTFSSNTYLKEIQVPEAFEAADFFISAPKIKTHMDCIFTCALKNQFGCNPIARKSQYHKRLKEAIVDLNVAFKPDLIIVDGIVAMEGCRGPTAGLPVRMNTLLFGKDPVAVDHFASTLIGFDPKNIPYIQEAEKRGLGSADYSTVGIQIAKSERKFLIGKPKLSNLYCLFQRS